MPNIQTLTIGGVDRSSCLSANSLNIVDGSNEAPSTATFDFIDRDSLGTPDGDEEVIITLNGEKIFGGYTVKPTGKDNGGGNITWSIECVDYNRVLDRRLVVESFVGMTDKQIIQSIVNNYCSGTGITTTNVSEGVTINQITFNYVPPSECITQIARLTGYNWFLDYNKDIHYFPLTTTTAPFNITDGTQVKGLQLSKNSISIRNRVYVRGGKYLSDNFTYSVVADGEAIAWVLPDKPHEFTLTEDSVSKTVGIKNIDDPLSFDYLLNFQEKYIEIASGTPPAQGTVLTMVYKYEIPILVALEDRASIDDIGVFEYAIFDPKISTIQQARDRATAELTDYANKLIDGSFNTYVSGFRAGQYIHIDRDDFGVDDDYLVQSVTFKSIGGGNYYYTVSIASAETIGMIRFLIRLIENNKNFLDISSDEVVDELFQIPTDSVTVGDESLDITSENPPFLFDSAKFGFSQFS